MINNFADNKDIKLLDVEKIIYSKNPALLKVLPSFVLNYLRKVTDALSLNVGFRAVRFDYHCALSYSAGLSTPATAPVVGRDDWDYIGSIGAAYAFTPYFGMDLNYSASFGRNADGTVLADTRNFNDQIVSLGATIRF